MIVTYQQFKFKSNEVPIPEELMPHNSFLIRPYTCTKLIQLLLKITSCTTIESQEWIKSHLNLIHTGKPVFFKDS